MLVRLVQEAPKAYDMLLLLLADTRGGRFLLVKIPCISDTEPKAPRAETHLNISSMSNTSMVPEGTMKASKMTQATILPSYDAYEPLQ